MATIHTLFKSTVKSPVKPRRPQGRRGLYSLYLTSRTEDVRRFYGMNWPSSYQRSNAPVNEYG